MCYEHMTQNLTSAALTCSGQIIQNKLGLRRLCINSVVVLAAADDAFSVPNEHELFSIDRNEHSWATQN